MAQKKRFSMVQIYFLGMYSFCLRNLCFEILRMDIKSKFEDITYTIQHKKQLSIFVVIAKP